VDACRQGRLLKQPTAALLIADLSCKAFGLLASQDRCFSFLWTSISLSTVGVSTNDRQVLADPCRWLRRRRSLRDAASCDLGAHVGICRFDVLQGDVWRSRRLTQLAPSILSCVDSRDED
jgi:hypothetical protein